MTGLGARLEGAPALRAVRDALAGAPDPVWVVGGTVRDALLGRPLDDVDLVTSGDAEALARRLAGALGGHVFPLSERFGAWRVLEPGRAWQADVSPARGGGIEADLALRDFTCNAIAAPLAALEPPVDPLGGRADVEAGLLRLVAPEAYEQDPLRPLRLVRLACELGFDVDPETARLTSEHAAAVLQAAPERIYYELRALLCSPAPLRGLELMEELGLAGALLPELEALRGVEQNVYHHLDAHDHTVAVLGRLLELDAGLGQPGDVFGEHGPALREAFDAPLGDQLTVGEGLRFAALFHDLGKPATRSVNPAGRVMFIGHDRAGAELCRAICDRLRAGARLRELTAQVTRDHLRLGFLVHERPLSRRMVYGYITATEPLALETTAFTVADRLATRGQRTRDEAVEAHLELAVEMCGEIRAWRAAGPLEPLVRGDELTAELELAPGPLVGRLLEHIAEARFAGEVSSRAEALDLARRLEHDAAAQPEEQRA